MSTNYKVTGIKAILGVGLTLKLTDKQAEIRPNSLKLKKKGIYKVLKPIEFKQGETITVVDGFISKSVLINLEDLSPNKSKKQDQKTTKVASKKDKKLNATPPATPEDGGEDDLTNPDEDNSSNENPDGDEDLQPEADNEKIVNNGDVNNLPAVIK